MRRCVCAFARRGGAFLCAVLLLFHLALFPLRARAAGVGALAAVAGVTVLGAYLMASGVYPYITEAGQGLSEWTADNLQPLIDKYNAYLSSVGKSYQIVLNGATPTIKGYLIQGVVMIANDVWGKLREFVVWLQSEYALTDNQTGAQLGTLISDLLLAPVVQPLKVSTVAAHGLYVGTRDNGKATYLAADASGVYVGNVLHGASGLSSVYGVVVLYKVGDSASTRWLIGTPGWNPESFLPLEYYSLTFNSTQYKYCFPTTKVAQIPDTIPVFDTMYDFCTALGTGGDITLSGITADTTTVAPLEALPDDVPWGGLAVEGTGAAASPAAVEGVIGGAITDRAKPVVRPVEVEIQQGTEVDTETGEIAENPVVITPDDVPLVASEYALPTAITTVFPFSLPWDFVRVLQALNAEPQPILFDVSFPHHGLTDGTGLSDDDFRFCIVFPPSNVSENETFSAFMAWFRNIELIVMCVAATWGIVSFIRKG